MFYNQMIRRTGLALFVSMFVSAGAIAQSPALELLKNSTRSAELQELSIASQAAENNANAANRRANLLSRQVRDLRTKNDQLAIEMESIRMELANTSAELARARKLVSSAQAEAKLPPAATGLNLCLEKCWLSLSKAIHLTYPSFPERAQMPELQLPPSPE